MNCEAVESPVKRIIVLDLISFRGVKGVVEKSLKSERIFGKI